MDIVERLKKLIGVHIGDADIDDRLEDAIAEIERLREGLQKIADSGNAENQDIVARFILNPEAE